MNEQKILHFDPTPVVSTDTQARPLPVLDGSAEEQFHRLLDLMTQHSPDPIEELAGYLVTEDPTYLPELPEAKALIRHMGRDKLLRMILSRVLLEHTSQEGETP